MMMASSIARFPSRNAAGLVVESMEGEADEMDWVVLLGKDIVRSF